MEFLLERGADILEHLENPDLLEELGQEVPRQINTLVTLRVPVVKTPLTEECPHYLTRRPRNLNGLLTMIVGPQMRQEFATEMGEHGRPRRIRVEELRIHILDPRRLCQQFIQCRVLCLYVGRLFQ